jgi:hypothetical protein
MRRQAPSTTNTIEVDGVEYAWQLRYGWLVEPDRGLKGVSVSVSVELGVTRELIVDFPFAFFGLDCRPSHARLGGVLPRAIHEAIEVGWVPHSRGKKFPTRGVRCTCLRKARCNGCIRRSRARDTSLRVADPTSTGLTNRHLRLVNSFDTAQ